MQRNIPSRGVVGGHSEFNDILIMAAGENAVLPSNDDERDIKMFLLIVLMALVFPNKVMMKDRQKNLENSIEEGRTAPMSSESVVKTATGGFVADENREFVCCPACKKRLRVDQITAIDVLKQHSNVCPYLFLCARSITREILQQHLYKSVMEHLRQQWLTTKVAVALEMGFHPCLVLIALTRRHLRREGAFANAGVLVEALMDMEDPDMQRPHVMWNVTLLIKNLELLRAQPSNHAGATGVSTVFEQRPIGTKAQDRQKYSENSPSNSLETPTPPSPSNKNSNKETLLEETMRFMYRWRCKNCGKVDADRLITDCGHLSLCSKCLQMQRCCPICDTKITESIRVYAV